MKTVEEHLKRRVHPGSRTHWIALSILATLVVSVFAVPLALGLILDNRYSFYLSGHDPTSLDDPPGIELSAGQRAIAVSVDRGGFMPYTSPHLQSADESIVHVLESDDQKTTYIFAKAIGDTTVSYRMGDLAGGTFKVRVVP